MGLQSSNGEGIPIPLLGHLSLGPFTIVVAVCMMVEMIVGIITWWITRVTAQQQEMSEQRQILRVGVAKTNYPSMFVENSKLQRMLLRVEKQIEKDEAEKAARVKKVSYVLWVFKISMYMCLVVLFWGQPLVAVSMDFLWPCRRVYTTLSGGAPGSGSIGVLGVVSAFHLGVASRFAP